MSQERRVSFFQKKFEQSCFSRQDAEHDRRVALAVDDVDVDRMASSELVGELEPAEADANAQRSCGHGAGGEMLKSVRKHVLEDFAHGQFLRRILDGEGGELERKRRR